MLASGTDNSTKDTEIAAIPATPTRFSQRQFSQRRSANASSATISSQSDDRISINHFGSRSWHCEYDPAGGPIEIWQYRFAECVVDFFFYPASQGSSQLIIKDWDMRSAVIGGRVNEGKCLAAMDRHHQKLVAGS